MTELVSLDGVMEAPGGGPDFKYPGWSFEFDRGDDGNQFKLDQTRRADALRTPHLRELRRRLAAARRRVRRQVQLDAQFVVSTTLEDPEWNNTTVLDGGDATAAVHEL